MTETGSIGIDQLASFALETIRKVGDSAMEYFAKGNPKVKFDNPLVTEAELKLVQRFQAEVQSEFPEHQIFGDGPLKEGYTHGEKGLLWVYDALDGVANYQAGIPVWGTSVALYENFWPVLGVFYMPATGDIYHARAGEKAFWGDKKIEIPNQEEVNNESVLLTYSRFNDHYETTFPGKIRNFGCTAAHICYVARGRAEAAIVANASYRDLAAARIILEAAGGQLLTIDGENFYPNEYMEKRRIDKHVIALPRGSYEAFSVYLDEK